MIIRERAFQGGRARKGDDAQAICFQLIRKGSYLKDGAGKPIGTDVCSLHAAGHIDGKDDVHAGTAQFLLSEIPLRARQCHDYHAESPEQKKELQAIVIR